MRINEVIAPTSLNEALAAYKRDPDSVLYAGGTELFGDGMPNAVSKPQTVLALHAIPELRTVSRTDHYVEVGAMTPLSELLSLKEGFIPEALRETIRNVGTFAVRNLATLGGNLCNSRRFRDCFPPLACMDALAEFRYFSQSRWINLNRLVDGRGLPVIPRGEILTRIRIPLKEWSLNVVQKLGSPRINSYRTSIFVLFARMEKRALVDFRIFYSSDRALRNKEIEASLLGKKLPLTARDADATLNAYGEYCKQSSVPETESYRFLPLVQKALALVNEGADR